MGRLLAFVVRHVPGAGLLARGFDFFVGDPLHHYMDRGLLKGIKKRAEETSYADNATTAPGPSQSTMEPVATD